MDLLKSLIELITSFFKNSTAKKKEELSLATKTEIAVVETIRATENAVAVQQQQRTQEAVTSVKEQQRAESKKQSTLPLEEQLDNQFGDDS